jgi:hypothetical protein
MKTVYAFFSGFTQSWEHVNGVEYMWRDIRHLASDDVWVLPPLPWDTDTTALRELICRHAYGAEVNIVAYSWGAGHASINLADELGKVGMGVVEFIACDPVYRSKWLPDWIPDPLALVRRIKIAVPANVKHVNWLRQYQDPYVCGHDLVAEDASRTKIEPAVVVKMDHTDIDYCEQFKDMVRDNLLRHGFTSML